jgi:shikimate dehydrogenase
MVILGVLGNPVKHSLSPLIHNAWLKENAIDGLYQTILVEKQENLEEVFLSLPKNGYAGINVTVPYKVAVLEIAKKHGFDISPVAEEIGAVNTVNFLQKTATNTDAYGFGQMVKIQNDCQALVIGAGGASPAVIYSLYGANITIANRTPEKAEILADKFMCDLYRGDLEKLDLSHFDIIVNTTSLGLNGEDLPLNYKTLKKSTKCVDIIYNPKMTPFLTKAKQRGCEIANGSNMLIFQAVKAFENWFNIKPKPETAKKIMRDFIL